ncbi:MAG: glycerophosphodiester phosphodiesterase [Sphaerobacter sp.]|nr:glycerophosphodiester phosphodiesterase [Sphaerobacter sp.]
MGGVGSPRERTPPGGDWLDVGRPLLIAHRGGQRGERENTAAAFAQAAALGVDILECDVRRTADGALVLIHDAHVLVGGRRRAVAATTLAELRAALPELLTLDEFLAGFGGAQPINLDLKATGFEAEVADALRRHDAVARVLVSSVHAWSLRRLRRTLPELRVGLSRGHLASRPRGRALQTAAVWWLRLTLLPAVLPARWLAGARAVMLQHRVVTPWLVRALRWRGHRVFAWTVDDPAEAARVVRAGVDGIASNVPWVVRPAIDGP